MDIKKVSFKQHFRCNLLNNKPFCWRDFYFSEMTFQGFHEIVNPGQRSFPTSMWTDQNLEQIFWSKRLYFSFYYPLFRSATLYFCLFVSKHRKRNLNFISAQRVVRRCFLRTVFLPFFCSFIFKAILMSLETNHPFLYFYHVHMYLFNIYKQSSLVNYHYLLSFLFSIDLFRVYSYLFVGITCSILFIDVLNK